MTAIEHPPQSSADTSGHSTPQQQSVSEEDTFGDFLTSLPDNLNLRGFDWITDEEWGRLQAPSNTYVAPEPFYIPEQL